MRLTKRLLLVLIAISTLGSQQALGVEGNTVSPELAATTVDVTRETPVAIEDIEERATALAVPHDEAQLRLQLERASIGFESDLIVSFPDTFAGVWLEADGPPGLSVALTHVDEGSLSRIQAMFDVPEAINVLKVDHSLAELLALQELMIQERGLLQQGALTIEGLDSTGGTYDLDIDVKANVVVVRVSSVDEEIASSVKRRYGEMVVLKAGATAPECTRTDCRYTLRGGLLSAGTNHNCSSAFTARTPITTTCCRQRIVEAPMTTRAPDSMVESDTGR